MASAERTELTVLGQSLQSLYTQYVRQDFVVNRRYQRKLVWSVEEKQSLVDSVRKNLPIPLVLLAESSSAQPSALEIIDGLQRLNAIFSFLENEFTYEGGFFDLETLADTKFKRDEGQLVQKEPKLDRSTCLAIVNYQLPVSTYRSATEESVDEVFRRINSSGRKLSLQEIRQAGVTSQLADLVRRISASVRGDVSLSEVLPLGEMPKISITNRDLPYGIRDESIFWVSNGILDKDSVRESRDEELVLDLLLDVILDPMAVSGTAYRNSAYGRESNATASAGTVAARLNTLGADVIENNFIKTLDLIKEIIESSGQAWASLVITQQNPRGIPRYFHAIFVALYELLFVENLRVKDLHALANEFDHFWDRDLTIPAGGGNWGANRKRPLFDSVKAVLRPYFEQSDDPVAERARQTATDFEIELQMALTEQALFELKQGFTRLDHTKEFDDDAFEGILRTASAMANKGPGVRGFVIIGVADRPADAARIAEIYGVDSIKVGEYHVTGTQHELTALGRNRDQHLRWLVDRIKASKLEGTFASKLAESLTLFDYKGYLIWTLRPEAGVNPTSWDGRFHVRQGNSTIELQGQQIVELMRRFPSA
ncbi:DUF262 domain-containing protein [Mycobacterium sp. 360MFTsu5.1]|uniref:DUF262 domain-containing protein n=1 Tax=Mycobacterium sp. 360MFTsu5.1 TaxID=1172186 RepID=UPI0003AA59C4|nr:DUF262 domain-containing protein [Mycobacterium sp. 360MFTsu5.1]